MAEEDKAATAPAAQETAPESQAASTKPAAAPTEEKAERKTSIAGNTTQVTARAKRRREEAVRRLVTDVQARPETRSSQAESQDWIVASTVAAALERGLDRDLHQELVQEAKENSGRIGQVCHDHSDVFLASVGKVVALGGPSADLANKLLSAQEELELKTAGPMITSAHLWETAKDSHSRATALYIMVNACQKVAMWLERARKQAALGRPRAALEAVDEARTALTAPMSSLFYGTSMEHAASYLKKATQKKELLMNTNTSNPSNPQSDKDGVNAAKNSTLASLEETPFGRRAILMLPKIENEVLMGARRGLNRWFLALRSGGDGAKAGRAVLRKCAYSMAVGPGQLGLGGHVPPSYLWRSKVSDNLISRMNQNGRVVRAVRLGFWFERDGPKEAARLEQSTAPGMERRAEAFASAFGWYRCWDEHVSLMVDPSDYSASDMGRAAGLADSRHGLGGSRHGAGASRGGRTLGFRASRQAQTTNMGLSTMASTGTNSNKEKEKSKWAALLTPAILFDNTPTR
jgi:predicted GNAT family acetyltransferase